MVVYILKLFVKRGSKGFLAARAWLAYDMARTHASTGVDQNFKEKLHPKYVEIELNFRFYLQGQCSENCRLWGGGVGRDIQ